MPPRSADKREPRSEEPGDIPGRRLLPAGTSAETGRLTMAFADGGERCEAFTVTGFLPAVRRGLSFTALPGGQSRL